MKAILEGGLPGPPPEGLYLEPRERSTAFDSFSPSFITPLLIILERKTKVKDYFCPALIFSKWKPSSTA
jgi:hypothetical protein